MDFDPLVAFQSEMDINISWFSIVAIDSGAPVVSTFDRNAM